MTIAYVLSAISGIYGLFWIIFAFVQPPDVLSYFFRMPMGLWFLPDRVAKIVTGLFLMVAVPLLANYIVSMFLG